MSSESLLTPVQRIRVWYGLLLLICGLFIIRLFYLQIIKHDYYQSAALSKQLKQYEIPAERGVIEVQSGNARVPLVLNETRFTLVADPKAIKDVGKVADEVQAAVGGNSDEYKKLIEDNNELRYVVLAKKLGKQQKESIDKLELKGIDTREAPQRTYPQGTLGAQVLGFVDDAGQGKYGIEEALDDQLKGMPGELKAITDARGIPLAANKDNIAKAPKNGQRVLLTIDLGMQKQLEDILKNGVEKANSKFGGAVIIEAKTGAIKAMANFPTFNPAEFYTVETKDIGVFQNSIVSSPLEIGSIMKPLTLAAALDLGVVNKNTSYHDPGSFKVDGSTITNVEEAGGSGTRNMGDIIQRSLNTGATWLLMQMGGGEINEKARVAWHDYMTNHYGFGKVTGIEQGYEDGGTVPSPTEGFGLNIQFANTAFGQGMRATPLQMAAAASAVLNGGTYYKPHLVAGEINDDGSLNEQKPEVVRQKVVSEQAGRDVKELMEYAFSKNHTVYGMAKPRNEFLIGSKTGTAEVPKPGGGYYDDRYNGMFLGFVGGNDVQYVIVVRVDEPKVSGYAGSKAAGPIFVNLANMLIDNFGVTPKT